MKMKPIFLIIAAFVGVSTAQTGTCPPTDRRTYRCGGRNTNLCESNTECSNGQMCCFNGCRQECRNPIFPGSRSGDDKCPPSRPVFGICTFDPNVNCLEDTDCQDGKVCCPHGCGKICKPRKNPKYEGTEDDIPTSALSCPAASSLAGACVFRPDVNCLADSECGKGKLCCPDGCGKVCKPGVKRDNNMPGPPISGNKCPVNVGFQVRTCVFTPSINCVDNSECGDGKICCRMGCNKECVRPE